MRLNLIEARKNKKYTQVTMSTKLSVTERYYRKLEAGTSNGSIEIWQELKKITGYPIDYLLEQDSNEVATRKA